VPKNLGIATEILAILRCEQIFDGTVLGCQRQAKTDPWRQVN
jgi:hypothetical protein